MPGSTTAAPRLPPASSEHADVVDKSPSLAPAARTLASRFGPGCAASLRARMGLEDADLPAATSSAYPATDSTAVGLPRNIRCHARANAAFLIAVDQRQSRAIPSGSSTFLVHR